MTDAWRNLRSAKISPEALKGLTQIELDHPQEEAQAIALLLREALETPGKTAALVTPDRNLAERVVALLARWGIAANHSAGTPLSSTPAGSFLMAVLAAADPDAGAIDLLTLLKHPFAGCGLNPAACRAKTREAEIALRREEPAPWLKDIRQRCAMLARGWNKELPLAARLEAHIKLAEELAASDQDGGRDRLWKGEDGELAATRCDEWREAAQNFPPLTGGDYMALFAGFLRAQTVRPAYGQHPRLSILGPLEARLIQPDLTILGGLNEGVWPPEAPIDPWMSRPMREKFGLPSPERRIGLSAHDFVQLAAAPEVVLTRARNAGSAPMVPSRFLLELEAVLRALGFAPQKVPPLAEWARALDQPPAVQPVARPEPRPAAELRPTQLPVTAIGTWQRNPYAIYAKHILKLDPLDPLDTPIDAADRGILIHEALDRFIKKYPAALPADAERQLLAIGRELFKQLGEEPEAQAFWWPRFARIATRFVALEQRRRAEGITIEKAEASGKAAFGTFTLRGRADRIDRLPDGELEIIDYKTGSAPTNDDVARGLEPQLPLLA